MAPSVLLFFEASLLRSHQPLLLFVTILAALHGYLLFAIRRGGLGGKWHDFVNDLHFREAALMLRFLRHRVGLAVVVDLRGS